MPKAPPLVSIKNLREKKKVGKTVEMGDPQKLMKPMNTGCNKDGYLLGISIICQGRTTQLFLLEINSSHLKIG